MRRISVFTGFVLVLGLIIALSVMGLLGIDPGTARAASLCVNPAGGACYTTIQAAVNAGSNGDVINIAAGTYTEHVEVNRNLSFIGAGANSTFIDGSNTGRVFKVVASSAAFTDLTIQNGSINDNNGAGIYVEGALTLTCVNVLSNTATGSGMSGGGAFARGAIVVTGSLFSNNRAYYGGGLDSWVSIAVTNSDFISNTAEMSGGGAHTDGIMVIVGSLFMSNTGTGSNGGGIYTWGGAWLTDTQFISNNAGSSCGGAFVQGFVWVVGTQFYSNTAKDGGGLCSFNSAEVTNSYFNYNHATGTGGGNGNGGGLFSDFGSALTISGTLFISNAGAYGGGIWALDQALVTNTQFLSNTARSMGGGFYAGALLRISSALFRNNSSSTAGGLYTIGDASVTSSEFISNSARPGSGGGIGASRQLMVSDTLFLQNYAADDGGGLVADKALITNCTFNVNQAGSDGGGIYAGGTVTLTGTHIVSNTAGALGGGLHADGASVIGSEFISNTATGAGGGLYVFYDGVTVTNTLFSNNTSSNEGGGLYSYGGVIGSGMTFIKNRSLSGGGFYARDIVVITDSVFSENQATTYGGGMYGNNKVIITGTEFVSNTSTNSGGGVYATGPATVNNTRFISNAAITNYGGGLYANGELTVTNAVLDNNSAGNSGGGGYARDTTQVAGTLFLNNSAQYGGGAFVAWSGRRSSFINVLLQANCATSEGSALYLFDSGNTAGNKAVILHTTIASPTIGATSAIYAGTTMNSPDELYITNTIIASYSIGIKLDSSVVVTSDYNLFYNAPTSVAIGSHSITGTNPMFVNPDGGDYHLSAASAAIDAGTDAGVVTDLDGNSRPYSLAYDIGAYESPFKGAMQVFLTKAGTGTGSVTSTPEGLDCGTNCDARFAYLEVVTLTATPVANSTFTGWTVTAAPSSPLGEVSANEIEAECTGTDPCVVVMTENKIITATFTIQTRTLTVGMQGTGGGTVTPTGGIYEYGAVVTVTAEPYISSTFTGWTAQTLPLGAVNINGPSVECPGTGACLVTMNANKAVTATFTLKTFTITPTAGANGSIVPSTPQTVNYGANQTFTISVNKGYYITDVGIDGISQDVITTYTFSNVTATHVITASFMKSVGPWYVSTTGNDADACISWGTACRTISNAISLASNNDVIYIAAGTYTENVTVPTIISFIGSGADATIVNGNNAGRVFYVTASSVTFSQLTIQNGRLASGSGAGIYVEGSVSLSDMAILSNTAVSENGGGLWAIGAVVITNSVFSNNKADYGGGLWAYDTVTMTGTQFISNTASYGAGLYTQGSLEATNSQFMTNSATSYGGGLFALGAVTVFDSQFFNNSASQGAGLFAQGLLVVTNSQFLTNSATSFGGGIYAWDAVTVFDSQFISNTASGTDYRDGDGGGIYAGGSATLTGTHLINNTSGRWGGGFYTGGAVTLTGTHFVNNTASTGGGGFARGDALIVGTEFLSNAATDGGGLYSEGVAVVSGTQFIRNTAGAYGGGLCAISGATVTNTEFISNTADLGGGLKTGGITPLEISNALFSNNTAGSHGGGLYTGGMATITGTEFISNTATRDSGGGLYAEQGVMVTNTQFNGNIAGDNGGGLSSYMVVATGVQFLTNTTNDDGGGLWAWGAVTVTNSLFSDNYAGRKGGGIAAYAEYGGYSGDAVTVIDSQFIGNTAAHSVNGRGGGIYAWGSVNLTGILLRNNTSGSLGGGLYADGVAIVSGAQCISNSAESGGGIYLYGMRSGESRFVNVLFEANIAQTEGAALYLFHLQGQGGNVTILHSTVVSPSLGAKSAVYVGKPGGYAVVVGITNTIVASYTTGISVMSGVTITSDYNLFYNAPTSVAIGSHSISGTNPLFADPLAGDYHLTPASLAVDAGMDAGITSDLDGNSRPFGWGYDMGAYELQVPGIRQLSVTTTGTGSGSVTSDPSGIDCGSTCTAILTSGSIVTLTATPLISSTFTGWQVASAPVGNIPVNAPNGSCAGAGACVLLMTGNKTVTATFTLQTFAITPTAGLNGSITPGTVQTVTYGSDLTFTITPDSSYHIADMRVDGVPVTISEIYTFTNVTSDHTLTASFGLNSYTLTVNKDGTGDGSVALDPSGGTYNHGTVVTLTATPLISSTFSGWQVAPASVGNIPVNAPNGSCAGDGECVLLMTGNKIVTATFTLQTFTITPTAGANGSITPDKVQTVDYGASQMFTISADSGYHIADVAVDGTSVGITTSYTFSNITASHTITAAFDIDTFVLTTTVAITNSGSILIYPEQEIYHEGDVVTLTAVPAFGWFFTGWTGDIVSNENPITMTFRSDISVVANFGTRYYFLPLSFTVVPTVQELKEP